MEKIVFKLVIFFLIAGCITKPVMKKPVSTDASKQVITTEEVQSESEPVPEAEPGFSPPPMLPTPRKIVPKIGIIFSGGGAKAWAHVGVIKEIEKAKWPIYSVAGFEMGAVVAAVYANNLSSNEIEWELSKIKDFENVEEIGNSIFEKKSVSDLKVPFVCSSLNIGTQLIYLLNRGQLNKLIPFCLAQPPLNKPYSQSIAEMHDVGALAKHLRATGANRIVLINVLSQNKKHSFTDDYLSSDNILWAKSAALMAKKISGVDDVVNIKLDSYGIAEISKKREIIAKGAELGYNEIRKLTTKYGL